MLVRPLVLAAIALSAIALPAVAQIERLPATSRSEANTNAIGNSLESQGRSRGVEQQNQFEINSLRSENSVRSIAPAPIVIAPPIAGPAPVRP